jgi:hypothetical protein
MDRRAVALALCLAALPAAPAAATSVRSLGIRELAAGAGLVFEGRALASEVRDAPGGGLRTCVRFEVLEVLKGSAGPGPLELCFAGGSAGRRTRRVEGSEAPATGERGVYFVRDPVGSGVHPLLGWDQGRFLVHEAAGAAEVTTAGGEPILALDPGREGRAAGPSRGVARGALVAPPGARGMEPEAFKARLREILAEAAP